MTNNGKITANTDIPDELTPETLAYIRWQEENPDIWGDQDENGIDLARLRENLRLTPAERIDKHARALASVLEMEEAGARHRATEKDRTGFP